jgi:long-chain-fatty-acid---luciferin-component ligase
VFRKKVEQVLGIPEENCRDVYGMSESVVPFVGCEGHYFHIMNTLVQPFVLDNELNPKGFGEYGRLAFLNALGYGYPCYIITGDRVKLLENCPACGRPGPVIEPPVTRIQGAEDRGCASVMRKLMTEEMESD